MANSAVACGDCDVLELYVHVVLGYEGLAGGYQGYMRLRIELILQIVCITNLLEVCLCRSDQK
jgi:hypothetical protein